MWERLRRRKVVQWGVAYIATAWALLQGLEYLSSTFEWSRHIQQLATIGLIVGVPIVLVLAWYHGDRGNQRVGGSELAILTLLLLLGGGAFWYYQRAGDTPTITPPPLVTAVATTTDLTSIAVLPFVNMSADKEQEYFADGISEELLNLLSQVPELRVIARTSSFSFKGKDVTIAEVAKTLGVDHVLEGSVRTAGDRVRITAQLIRASDSSNLWSKSYDRALKDVFAIQDEISRHVVDALKVQLLGAGTGLPEVGGTQNSKAYEAYLRGRHLRNQGLGEQTLRAALAAFDLAVAEDASYAQAHAGRAGVLNAMTLYRYEPFDTGFARAREAALHAARLAPELAEAYVVLGYVAYAADHDVPAALAHFDRALGLSPGNAYVQRSFAFVARAVGLADQAIDADSRAVELDPIDAAAQIGLSRSYYSARRYAESLAVAHRALALNPEYPSVHGNIGYILLETGDLEAARTEFEKDPIDWTRQTGIVLADAKLGRTQIAREGLAAAIAQHGEKWAHQYARINAQLGDPDESFRWLETARRIKDPGVMAIRTDPLVDPLRKDPRFGRLMHELGLDALDRGG